MQSLRQFSRLAGVSPSTVSRVFSGTAKVAPETEQRILDLAKSLGFRPNAVAKVAFGGQTRSVGILLPSLDVSYFANIAAGLQERLLEENYLPVTLIRDAGGERRSIQRLLDHRVDALVMNLIEEDLHPEDLSMVLRAGVPLISLSPNAALASLQADSVINDDVQGGQIAAEHLLSLGHERIGFCYFGDGHSPSDLRLSGAREVLARKGLLLQEREIVRLPPKEPNLDCAHKILAQRLLDMLSRPDRPTAIFASTDVLAGQIYHCARALKLQIPHDLSIIGFGNLNFGPHMDPPLTSVDQNGFQLGLVAGEVVLKRLQDPECPPQSHTIPVTLVERHSTQHLARQNNNI